MNNGSITPPPRNWRIGREKYGQIRSGQFWKKIDTGRVMRICGKNVNDCWTVHYVAGGRNSDHVLKMRDIYKYYDRID